MSTPTSPTVRSICFWLNTVSQRVGRKLIALPLRFLIGGCSPCWKRTLKVRGKERLNKSLHFTCRSKTYLVLTEQWYGTCKPARADIGKVLEPLKPMIFLHLFDGLFSAFIETLSLQRRVLLFILMKKPYRLSNDPGLQSYHYSSAVTAK